MIHGILVLSNSGLVLFSRSISNEMDGQKNLFGSLLSAVLEFGLQITGLHISYLEFSELSMTIYHDIESGLCCVVLHNKDDGLTFTRLIASEILRSFIMLYSGISNVGRNLKDFYGFNGELVHIAKGSVRSVLASIESLRGVRKSVFVFNDLSVYRTSMDDEDDHLELSANTQYLISMCDQCLELCGDSCQSATFDVGNNSRIAIWRILNRDSLIVVLKKNINVSKFVDAISPFLEILEKASNLSTFLADNSASMVYREGDIVMNFLELENLY